MVSGRLSDVYYTAKEARERLGLNETTFHLWVRDERIRKVMLPGRKQGLYAKKEVDRIIAEREIAMLADQSLQLDFREATLENQYDELMLARMVYGDVTARFDEKRKELLEKVPGMTHYLYDGNFLVASLNLLPMQSEGIAKFRNGERGWLLGEHAEPFVSGKPLECIIIDFLTTPRVPRNQRTNYANFLLARMAGVFADWGRKGIEVTALYACGSTPDGVKVLTNSNFEYLGEPKPGRRMYKLDVAKAKLHILDGYQRNLAKYKAKHK
jgi:hypothetical protein